MSIVREILKMFKVQKMENCCNYKDCENSADKEAVIYQYDYKKGRNDLAKLFICNNHIDQIDLLLKKLKNKFPDIVIDKEINDL